MNDSQEVLSSVLKAAQLSQTGIRSVLDKAMASDLSNILKHQLRELSRIESEARAIASQRGWELREMDPVILFLFDRRSRITLRPRENNSSIAGLLIQSNVKNRIQGLKSLHRYSGIDQISTLSQKLIDCQTAAIRQLEPFL